MGKYLITGVAGAGKSTVISELNNRGFKAYDTDDLPDVTRLQDKVTGKFVSKPTKSDPANFQNYSWDWQEEGLKKLLESDETVFVGASVNNQSDFYPLFDSIFALLVDEDTQRHRLANRSNNDTGNDPKTREYLVGGNSRVQSKLLDFGAIAIVGSKPLDQVVDEILMHINES